MSLFNLVIVFYFSNSFGSFLALFDLINASFEFLFIDDCVLILSILLGCYFDVLSFFYFRSCFDSSFKYAFIGASGPPFIRSLRTASNVTLGPSKAPFRLLFLSLLKSSFYCPFGLEIMSFRNSFSGPFRSSFNSSFGIYNFCVKDDYLSL